MPTSPKPSPASLRGGYSFYLVGGVGSIFLLGLVKGLTKEVAVPADPLMLAAGSLRYLTFTGLLFTLPFVLAVLLLVREWRLAG